MSDATRWPIRMWVYPLTPEMTGHKANNLRAVDCKLSRDDGIEIVCWPADQAPEPVAWIVFDEQGVPEYVASYREACHEHINDALAQFDMPEAAKWIVRPAYLAPPDLAAEVERLKVQLTNMGQLVTLTTTSGQRAEAERDKLRAEVAELREKDKVTLLAAQQWIAEAKSLREQVERLRGLLEEAYEGMRLMDRHRLDNSWEDRAAVAIAQAQGET